VRRLAAGGALGRPQAVGSACGVVIADLDGLGASRPRRSERWCARQVVLAFGPTCTEKGSPMPRGRRRGAAAFVFLKRLPDLLRRPEDDDLTAALEERGTGCSKGFAPEMRFSSIFSTRRTTGRRGTARTCAGASWPHAEQAAWQPGDGATALAARAPLCLLEVRRPEELTAKARAARSRAPEQLPRAAGAPGRLAWRADLALLDAEHRRLREAIASFPPSRLAERLGKATARRLLYGIAAHDLYHAGQVRLLIKLAGASGGGPEAAFGPEVV